MSSQGPNSPGTASGSGWNYVNNIKTSDNNRAYESNVSDPLITEYLKATNFGFSIPDGSTINGIVVEIERYMSGNGDVQDNTVSIIKSDGTIGVSNYKKAGSWGTSENYISYGGVSDLWGESWGILDINNSNFGVALKAYLEFYKGNIFAYVDHMRITVYYTEGGSSSAIKTVNGLAKASVATADGLAIASVKTMEGLA